jgi:hypothetical protein
MFPNFPPAVKSATIGLGIVAFAAASQAQPHESTITCTNPASGANWQIRIDFDRSTVDSNSARVSPTQISWHDAAGGSNYTLDRKSGDLTAVAASSTGGYFLHDHCKLEKPS